MITSSGISTKLLSKTSPGELVRFRHSSKMRYAIVAAILGPNAHVCFLEAPVDGNPRLLHMKIGGERSVISYGHDWVLEPIQGLESWPGNNDALNTNGRLVLTESGYKAYFHAKADDPEMLDELWFDLTNNKFVETVEPKAIPMAGWRVWESRGVYQSPKGAPLVKI